METQSEDINELMAAMAKAQSVICSAKKDKTNPFFKSSYADLASVWEACRSGLSENGIAIVQCMQPIDGTLILVTTLGHSSGQWMKSYLPVITQKSDPQSLGSSITYMRRYSLSAMVGVAPEDDDGEQAVGDRTKKCTKVKASTPKAKTKTITIEQAEELDDMIGDNQEYRGTLHGFLKKHYDIGSLSQMPANILDKVMVKVNEINQTSQLKGA